MQRGTATVAAGPTAACARTRTASIGTFTRAPHLWTTLSWGPRTLGSLSIN